MKRARFSAEQIVGILKEHKAGRKVAELAREHGVSEATLYGWKSKYGGMEAGEAQRLRSLEDENRRLKHLVADLSLDKEALKAAGKNQPARATRRSNSSFRSSPSAATKSSIAPDSNF
jgi:putative transposase